ncbi:MAG: diguanylate cyclase [Desulfovibrionaceae bacterium]
MKKNSLLYTNITICIIIALGFLVTSYISHVSNTEMLEKDISNISKLSSENIYSKINSLLEKPIHISLTMANDVFLQKLMLEEEKHLVDPDYLAQLQEYLLAYQEKYQYDSIFLVSEKSKRYYHYHGIDRIITPDKPENVWYYKFLKENVDHSLYVDVDAANADAITIFVNCTVRDNIDKDAPLLGVVGVGLKTEYVQKLLQQYEKEFSIKAYLMDSSGNLQVSSQNTKFSALNFFNNKYFSAIKEKIIHNKVEESTHKVSMNGIDTFYIIQYIPNLQWYLVVEKDTTEITKNFRLQYIKKICIIFLITILVLFITTKEIRAYNKRIMQLMSSDPLTAIRNRFSYEQFLEKYNQKLDQHTQVGIAVFDLNGLKHINDTFGHATGDSYISNSAKLICKAFSHCPVFRIGGDEFSTILENIDADAAEALHETMLTLVAEHNEKNKIPLSIAFGYAFYEPSRDTNLEQVFTRADANMYSNKVAMKKALLAKAL